MKKFKPHNYIVHEKVLVRDKKEGKFEQSYLITNIVKNGTITISQGAIQECMIIIWMKPHHE